MGEFRRSLEQIAGCEIPVAADIRETCERHSGVGGEWLWKSEVSCFRRFIRGAVMSQEHTGPAPALNCLVLFSLVDVTNVSILGVISFETPSLFCNQAGPKFMIPLFILVGIRLGVLLSLASL